MSEKRGSFKVGDKQGESGKKRLKQSSEDLREDTKIVPKYRNYIKFLNNRELGATAGVQAKTEFYQIKTSHKEKISCSDLQIPFSYDSCEVNFISGDNKSFYGMWCTSNDSNETSYVVGHIIYGEDNESSFSEYWRSEKIVDMCPGFRIFVLASDYPPEHLPPFITVLGVRVDDYKQYCPPPWYSCSYLPNSRSALLGGDGYIAGICRRREGAFLPGQLKVPGKVCTLSYHEKSRLLLSGLHTGVIWFHDYRVPYPYTYSIKISDEAINDSVFLNDQEVIVTDVKGKLVKVDLRTRGTSDMFFGHKHSVTKRPFSVANNILCATGVDNVVRIWHVSGGHPIHIHRSTSGHEVRGWLNSDANKTYLNYFERDTRTVYTI